MPRRAATPSKSRPADSLIDWRRPEQNAHVLDWRERAHEFGLNPIGETGPIDTRPLTDPERLLVEDDPEAFVDEPLDDADRDALPLEELEEEDDAEESSASELPADEPDLVRVYLSHIGRRKLLKAEEEQAIGRTIEQARGELLAELGTIPAARRT